MPTGSSSGCAPLDNNGDDNNDNDDDSDDGATARGRRDDERRPSGTALSVGDDASSVPAHLQAHWRRRKPVPTGARPPYATLLSNGAISLGGVLFCARRQAKGRQRRRTDGVGPPPSHATYRPATVAVGTSTTTTTTMTVAGGSAAARRIWFKTKNKNGPIGGVGGWGEEGG